MANGHANLTRRFVWVDLALLEADSPFKSIQDF